MSLTSAQLTTKEDQAPPFLTVIWQLTVAELYKTRRRRMSKVFVGILLFISMLVFAIIGLGAFTQQLKPTESFLPPPCSSLGNTSTVPCLDHKATQVDMIKAVQQKRTTLQSSTTPLVLPGSLLPTALIISIVGSGLLIFLVGSNVGEEYSIGTIRQLYVLGPSRLQFLLAKVLASLFYIIIGSSIVLLVSLLGYPFVVSTGLPIPDAPSFVDVLGKVGTLLLPQIVGLFVYAMMATCLAILGRSPVAGIVGAMVWSLGEFIVASGIGAINFTQTVDVATGHARQSLLSSILTAIPHYLISSNVNTLTLIGRSGGPGNAAITQAIVVLIVYTAVFIDISYYISVRRDVTN